MCKRIPSNLWWLSGVKKRNICPWNVSSTEVESSGTPAQPLSVSWRIYLTPSRSGSTFQRSNADRQDNICLPHEKGFCVHIQICYLLCAELLRSCGPNWGWKNRERKRGVRWEGDVLSPLSWEKPEVKILICHCLSCANLRRNQPKPTCCLMAVLIHVKV